MQRFHFAWVCVASIALAAAGLAQDPTTAEGGQIRVQVKLPPDGPGPAFPDGPMTVRTLGDVAFFSVMAGEEEPVKNAPYTATAVTESTQTLADGNRIVNKSSAFYARDSQGRVRREESMGKVGLLPVKSPQVIFINDPSAHTQYILHPAEHAAQVIQREAEANGPARHLRQKIVARDGAMSVNAPEKPDVKKEDLGTQEIEGVACQGTRETITIPAGQMGNERPLQITSESWYSPDLHTTLLRKHSDPRVGETVFRLTSVQRAEPDPTLFQVPSDYKTLPRGPVLPD